MVSLSLRLDETIKFRLLFQICTVAYQTIPGSRFSTLIQN